MGGLGESLRPRVQKIADRYACEIEWERYDTARGNLYADASGSDPVTHDLLETMQQIIESYRDFLAALGVRDYLDQMTWELLQSEHSLFAANAATLYDDTVPTLAYLRDKGFKLAIVSNWDTPLDPLTERLGIADYFDTITSSHDERVRSAKPDPHIFNYYTRRSRRFGRRSRACWGYLRSRYHRRKKRRHSPDTHRPRRHTNRQME